MICCLLIKRQIIFSIKQKEGLMNILLIYPGYENTFWNVNKVLKLLGKRAAYPPLGLLTVAAMLPNHWEKKLIDMNCGESLKDEHIEWADYVLIGSIIGQRQSTKNTPALQPSL